MSSGKVPAKPKGDEPTVPSTYAQTTPPHIQPQDFGYLEMVMELSKSMAQVSEKLNSVYESTKAQGDKIDKISHQVFAAKVVLWVVGGIITIAGSIVGFAVKEGVEYIIKTHH